MTPIYANFNRLDICFQCAVPAWILESLADAKEKARNNPFKKEITFIGVNEIPVLIEQHGYSGGFTYHFNTGFHGETWFIVDSPHKSGWNVKVSINSLTLALYGYKKIKKKILDFLINDLEAMGEDNNPPLERISRIDYCVDFKTDRFIPNPKAFFGKGRINKEILYSDNKSINQIIYSGENIQYLSLGTMPNRKVEISEITNINKKYWWKIWDIQKSAFSGEIWRVEIKAGKKELNKWDLRRFNDFEEIMGNIISDILMDIKYTVPSDTNKKITQWQTSYFWEDIIDISKLQLQEFITDKEKRNSIIHGIRNKISENIQNNTSENTFINIPPIDPDILPIPGVLDLLENIFLKNSE